MPTFTRGQWTHYSTDGKSYADALFRGANVAPYDTTLSGTSANGLTMQQAAGNGFDANAMLGTDSTGGVFVPSIQQWVALLGTGHFEGGSNEVNVFDMATGTWNPAGRPVNPTVRLYVTGHVAWPATVAYAGIHLTAPIAVKDIPGDYAASIALSQNGQRFAPLNRQTYGGVCDMPGTNCLLLFGGFGYWDAPTGAASVGFTYNYVTKQYQFLDAETWPSGSPVNLTSAVWDSTQSRALFVTETSLYAYYPSRAAGSRVVALTSGDGPNSDGQAEVTLVYDATRRRLLLFGADTPWQRYYTFNTAGTVVSTTSFTITGSALSTNQGPAVLYDPAADAYIHMRADTASKALISINPTTFVGTPITPTVGDTPPAAIPGASRAPGSSMFYKFWYWEAQDCYVAIPNGTATGAYVYAPTRAAVVPAPVLAFTDLVAGPRANNGDTSQPGQIAGQDGALVTLWGTNFGAVADTVTATIGGATCRIYDRGAAVPPRCPATLVNGFHNLQLMVVQVSHLAAVGVGTVSVSVNGVVSNTLPFEVTSTGTIYYAAPAGGGLGTYASPFTSIGTGAAALAPGDILYVRDGLNATGGVVIPSASIGATKPLAITAYPGATCQVGDSTHEGFPLSASGSGGFMTYSKFSVYGYTNASLSGSGENTLKSNARLIGCKVQAPLGQGSLGAVGVTGNNIVVSGNEFTNCGDPTVTNDNQYHTLYVYGLRGVDNQTESNRVVTWNYFHGNSACRAINCFNQNGTAITRPITGHNIQYNVIVDQEGDGILLGRCVVGDNTVSNNVLVRAGLPDVGGFNYGVGIDFQMTTPPGYAGPTLPPMVIHCQNNTLLSCGQAGSSGSGGFLFFGPDTFTPDFHNNIVYQANGLPYFAPSGNTVLPSGIATQWSKNLWFGAGAAPAGDVGSVNANPLVTSSVVPYNLHLATGSPALAVGTVVTGTDLDGVQRPATASDLGAYQFSTAVTVPPPGITSLSPASCLPGASNFTLTVFANASTPFLNGAVIQWDGIGRTTTFVTNQTVTANVLTSDVPVAATHQVAVINPGSAPSNSLPFNVTLGPAALSLVFNGTARDRVGQGTGALAPDGAFDGVFTVTLNAIGGRTITALRLDNDVSGIWDTDVTTGYFVLGVADTFDLAFRNDPVTMGVNFTVTDGGMFVLFASDFNGIEFVTGVTHTVHATFSDGSVATGSVLIQAPVTTTTVLKRLALAGGF